MNKKLLCAALLGGLGVAQAASAQDFDDRWYVSGCGRRELPGQRTATPRSLRSATLGFGKFLNPNWSLDGELNYQNPDKRATRTCGGASTACRSTRARHFRQGRSKWWPVPPAWAWATSARGRIRRDPARPRGGSPGQREDGNLAAKLGAGLQFDFGRVDLRTEVATASTSTTQQAVCGPRSED